MPWKRIVPRIRRDSENRWIFSILEAQLDHYRPDVVLNQALVEIPPEFWRRVKPSIPCLIGQISWIHRQDNGASGLQLVIDRNEAWTVYDGIISSVLPTVQWFRARGIPAELNRLAFEPRVLEVLQPVDPGEKTIDVSFVGSCLPVHSSRTQWLEALCRRFKVQVWTSDVSRLPRRSPIRRATTGPAWGRHMYEVLMTSRITLNHHGNTPPFAHNMRLYEATGVGTLLVTDQQPHLHELFDTGREVIAYRNADECVDRIEYFLRREERRIEIAAAGQTRTLQEHTYRQRMREVIAFIERLQSERHRAIA